MKRNLLAIAIPALLVAGAANASIEIWNKDGNKLDINGRVKAANYISVGKSEKSVDKEGDDTSARLGFTGQTQITDSLSGYGRFETEFKDGSRETRYAFAGLNFGQAGSIDYGKNDGVLKAIGAYTDVLPEFGGDSGQYVVLGNRTNAVLTYRNSALVDGLSFAVQYADSDDRSVSTTDNEAYGMNVQYSILDTGLTVGAGYAQESGKKTPKSYTFGINYDANNLYLAAIYAHTKDAYSISTGGASKKIDGFEVVAQYGIDFEVGRLTPSLAYVQYKGKNVKQDEEKYVEVGAQYDFNKNLTAIVDYKINQIKSERDTLALGLIYQF